MINRRSFLTNTYDGLRGIALASLLSESGLLANDANRPQIDQSNPYAARPSQFEPKAKNVLMVFCCGALSQVDTFDYKPELIRYDGKPLPGNENLTSFQGENGNLTRPLWQFRPRGEVGKMVSDLVPQIGKHSDEICYLHSLTTKTNTHGPAENMMSTGFTFDGFPSMGSWISYALGTANQDLPSFVAIEDPRGMPQAGPNNWASGFIPAAFQGTPFSTTKPIRYLNPPGKMNVEADLQARRVLNQLNQDHLAQFPGDQALAARIASYELAARMQMSIPEAAAVENESQHTLALYGADSSNKHKAAFGRNCLLARRLIERGVRFVQLFNGAYASGGNLNWDGHSKLKQQYDVHGEILDQPVAGLLADLKQRGLLESTLVVFCTEFGRMPMFQMGTFGRDHNPNGFTCWLAGAGVKTPYTYGATDEFGFKSTENVVTVHDFHATILHLLGLDHEQLTYYHNGIERRLTNVHGKVIHEILA